MEDVIFLLSSRMMAPGDMRLRELEEPVLRKRTKKSEPGEKTVEKEAEKQMVVEEAVELELDQVPDIINRVTGIFIWTSNAMWSISNGILRMALPQNFGGLL